MQNLNKPAQLNIDPKDLDDIACNGRGHLSCGSINFKQVFQMKKLSALMAPDGRDQMITIPVFICDDCGLQLNWGTEATT
jgi:hypothetical protein